MAIEFANAKPAKNPPISTENPTTGELIKAANPKTHAILAKNKISEDFIKMLRRKGIKKLVTADARAFYHLTKTLERLQIPKEELEILEFSDILCTALNLT